MATLIKPDGTSEDVYPQNGSVFTTEELEKYTGGYPYRFQLEEDEWMVTDEEATFKVSPKYNSKATLKFYKSNSRAMRSELYGDVLITTSKEIGQ